MDLDRNQHQITRIDARNCFVESLSDSFGIGKVHLTFCTYDKNRPEGQRMTNNIQIYIDIADWLELCRKLSSGELRWLLQQKAKNNDSSPIKEWLGGTSAEKLAQYGNPRPDGKSLSRTAQLLRGQKTEFLFSASSGPGEKNKTGLIVPRFGTNPENHVAVGLSWDSMSELLLLTKAHYEAWLSAWYTSRIKARSSKPAAQSYSGQESYSQMF